MRTILPQRLGLRILRFSIASVFFWTAGDAAAEMRLYQIAQPVLSEDERIVERQYVTYALNVGSATPGLEIHLTCHPGAGVVHGDVSRDTVDFSEIRNLNVANLLGITVQVENRPRGTWNVAVDSSRSEGAPVNSTFYVDRLNVTLDLNTLNAREPEASDPGFASTMARFDAVVAATVDCVLDNATRSEPPIRRIDLKLFGSRRYARYARAYPIAAAPKAKQHRF